MSLRQQKIYKGGFWKPLTTEGLVFKRGTYINIKYILIPELLKMLQKWVCLYKHRCGKKAKYIVKLFKKQFLNHICSMVRFFYTENCMLEETDEVILRHRGYHWKMDIQDYLLGYASLITDFKNKDMWFCWENLISFPLPNWGIGISLISQSLKSDITMRKIIVIQFIWTAPYRVF